MPIYNNIKAVCKSRGVSISKLEEDLGFTRSSLYKWDRHQPSIGNLKKVADYFNITVDELISEAQWEVSGNDESKNCQCNCN